ncbi:MAG TPA: hypothetical protein VIG62_15195, partial [Blastocatellia bacterium]
MERAELLDKWHRIELGATRVFQRVRLPANQKYFILTITIAVACGLVAVSYHQLINLFTTNLIGRAMAIEGP